MDYIVNIQETLEGARRLTVDAQNEADAIQKAEAGFPDCVVISARPKHAKALPSKLFYTTGHLRNESDAYDVFAIGDVTIYGDQKMGGVTEEQLAEYITRAANAYSPLVEMLRETANRLRGAAHDLRVPVIGRNGQRIETEYGFHTQADAERAGAWEAQADEADELLSGLGIGS